MKKYLRKKARMIVNQTWLGDESFQVLIENYFVTPLQEELISKEDGRVFLFVSDSSDLENPE